MIFIKCETNSNCANLGCPAEHPADWLGDDLLHVAAAAVAAAVEATASAASRRRKRRRPNCSGRRRRRPLCTPRRSDPASCRRRRPSSPPQPRRLTTPTTSCSRRSNAPTWRVLTNAPSLSVPCVQKKKSKKINSVSTAAARCHHSPAYLMTLI